MDVLAVTDFPDIRFKCLIQSASEGSIVVIPREGGYLVRLYIEMSQLQPGERAQQRDISAEQIIDKARRILHPYSLQVKDLAWWSVYEIGQRVCRSFDDLGNDARDEQTPRVFIAGDACHTHSPKAGQGMNVSMADAFNLGWKLAHVLTDKAPASLLKTYSAERQAIAEELIEFDRDMARLISERSEEEGKAASSEFQDYFIRHGRYTAGVEARYSASVLTGCGQHQALAAGYPVGKRFHSALVTRIADGRTIQLGHTIKADGRWRLVAFAPDEAVGDGAICALSAFLLDDVKSPLRCYTDRNDDPDAVIDCRVVFQQAHDAIETGDVPTAFLPRKGRFELIDYEKAFSAGLVQRTLQPHPQESDIFDLRGINRQAGCMLIVRPDQFVADVLPIDAFDLLANYFSQVLLEANR
jgi:phenol 2-monooxygenase